MAPVNEPDSWPNSSESISPSLSVEQFSDTSGCSQRFDK
ncbi:Uncharacterised protein [Vibrio cholerae]|nr:Uncharacterised protein [Vibrio cholerae]